MCTSVCTADSEAPDNILIFWSKLLELNGAQGRDRTTDTVIFSHVLYQLSYLGAGPARGRGSRERGAL